MGVEAAIQGKASDGTLKNVFVPVSAAGNTAIGYDNYQRSNGTTNLYGNSVRIWSKTGGLVLLVLIMEKIRCYGAVLYT